VYDARIMHHLMQVLKHHPKNDQVVVWALSLVAILVEPEGEEAQLARRAAQREGVVREARRVQSKFDPGAEAHQVASRVLAAVEGRPLVPPAEPALAHVEMQIRSGEQRHHQQAHSSTAWAFGGGVQRQPGRTVQQQV